VAVAAGSGDAVGWHAEFGSMFAQIAGRVGRVEARRRAGSLHGLLPAPGRQSCRQLAEQAADRTRQAAAAGQAAARTSRHMLADIGPLA